MVLSEGRSRLWRCDFSTFSNLKTLRAELLGDQGGMRS